MSQSDDPWIASNSPLDPDKLHALGVVNFHWNIVAQLLQTILGNLRGAPNGFHSLSKTQMRDIQRMRADEVVGSIRAELSNHYRTDKSDDYINRVLDAAEICRKNRNGLVHFYVDGFYNKMQPMTIIKNYFFDHDRVPDKLGAMRQVSEDTEALWKVMSPMLGDLTILWGLKNDMNIFKPKIPIPLDLFSKEAMSRPYGPTNSR